MPVLLNEGLLLRNVFQNFGGVAFGFHGGPDDFHLKILPLFSN